MGLRDLVTGRSNCAALGSSSNPLSSLADALLGYSPQSEFKKEPSSMEVILKASRDQLKVVPLSTVPGDENEIELDQGSIRSMKFKKELSETEVLLKASLDQFKVVPLSTVPGDENEIELDQGSIRSMKFKKELSATEVLLKASLDQFNVVPLSTVPGDENEIKLDQGSIRSMKFKKELSATEVLLKASLDQFKVVPLSTVLGNENEIELDQGSIKSMKFKKELSATEVLLKASLDQFKVVPLSTVQGDENETVLDQGSIRSMKGIDFVNGHHGYARGENFQTSIISVPELRGIERHFQESEQIDSVTIMNFLPNFDGPPEMDVPHPLRRSPFQPNNVWAHQSKEHLQGLVNRSMDYIDICYDSEMGWPRIIRHHQMVKFLNQLPAPHSELHNSRTEVLPHSFGQQHAGWTSEFEQAQLAKGQIGGTDITNMVVVAQPHMLGQTSPRDDHPKFQVIDRPVVSEDEFSGGWLSLLGVALSHLGGLSQPRFFDELIKWKEQVIGHRVWVKVDGLQQRSGWSAKVEATRKTLFDALQDAAMLAVITMRLHFPLEFRGTPFTILPMKPGRRSKLDCPAVGGNPEAAAATFMGINYDDVVTLQRERFASFHRERRESYEAFNEYMVEKQRSIALAEKMMEELPLTPEMERRFEDLLEMDSMVAKFSSRDCGWSVSVSNKAQQQQEVEEPSHLEDKPPTTASSPAGSVRARL